MSSKRETSIKGLRDKGNSRFGKLITVFIGIISAALVVVIVFYSTAFISSSNRIISNVFPDSNFFDIFRSFVNADGIDLRGKSNNRSNFLIIGKDFGVNTDTIIVLSYFHDTNTLGSLSLPRDLSVDDGYGVKKINAIYNQAETRYNNNQSSQKPEEFLSDFISDILNDDIHYWAKIDVDGFAGIIDAVGGVTIDIENSFSDCSFPTDDFEMVYYPELGITSAYQYPCPSFEAGIEKMNSKRALIYARSRKSQDNPAEAIDFARNQRQQKVIEAVINEVKSKFMGGSILLNTSSLEDLSEVFADSVSTNIKAEELISLSRRLPDNLSVNRQSLDYSNGIICPSSVSSYVILCDGTSLSKSNFGQSQYELRNLFNNLNPGNNSSVLNKLVQVTGNGSNVIPLSTESLRSLGFGNLKVDNVNTNIQIATSFSVENVYIYIENSDILDEFRDLDFQAGEAEVSFIDEIPSGFDSDDLSDINIFVY